MKKYLNWYKSIKCLCSLFTQFKLNIYFNFFPFFIKKRKKNSVPSKIQTGTLQLENTPGKHIITALSKCDLHTEQSLGVDNNGDLSKFDSLLKKPTKSFTILK